MRRIALLAALVAVGATTLSAPGSSAAPQQAPTAAKVETPYGLAAYGFATRTRGGDIPASTGAIGNEVIGCTNKAGIDREESVVGVELPGLGKVNAASTRTWTTKKNGVVASNTRHKIAGVTIFENILGKLEISGVEANAKAWHDSKGFHAKTSSDIASITYNGRKFRLPTPGTPLVIPGVAKIFLGKNVKSAGAHGARAAANVLTVKVIPTNTEIKVGQAVASIFDGAERGYFAGESYGVRADVLGIVEVGRTPRLTMPCKSTGGETEKKSVAGVDIDGLATVDAVGTKQESKAGRLKSYALEEAKVAGVDLLDGEIVIDGIKARAKATRSKSGKLTTTAKGSQTLSIKIAGEEVTLPPIGVLEIPGLVKIEEKIVKRIFSGIEVTALRVTLLDGSGLTLDVGYAKAQVKPGTKRG